jgi:hypothetical protein
MEFQMKLTLFTLASLLLIGCQTSVTNERHKESPVTQAILNKGNLAKVQSAVEKGGSVNEVEPGYLTSTLQYAIYNISPRAEQVAVVSYLLQKGADLSHTDSMGRNVFAEIFTNSRHPSSNYTDQEKLTFFQDALAGGMNVNFRERFHGNSPLIIIANEAIVQNQSLPLLALLLKNGADPDYKNIKGESAKSLIEAKANIELKEYFKSSLKNAPKKKSE